jgi:hypothetical protein
MAFLELLEEIPVSVLTFARFEGGGVQTDNTWQHAIGTKMGASLFNLEGYILKVANDPDCWQLWLNVAGTDTLIADATVDDRDWTRRALFNDETKKRLKFLIVTDATYE